MRSQVMQIINRKHEMFWNHLESGKVEASERINRKHEMFWNLSFNHSLSNSLQLTVNMKCFEIGKLAGLKELENN